MELNRALRILRSRWAIVATITLVGFLVAFGITTVANQRVDPIFEGVVVLEFELDGEESVEDLTAEIESERRLAIFALQDLMSDIPGSSIVADTNSARLLFVARGDSAEQARENVSQLVTAYLEADPTSGGNIGEQLAEYERQAEEIAAQLADLQPTLTPQEEALKAEHELLSRQIEKVKSDIIALTVADIGATDEEQRANADRRSELRAILRDLETEKSLLGSPPSEGLTPSEQLRYDTLQRRMDILEIEYQTLALRVLGVTDRGSPEPPVVSDLTPDPSNPFMNGVVGGIGGFGIALLSTLGVARARRELWLSSDLPLPVLGVVPKRRLSSLTGPLWYDSSESGERKESIQALRTGIEGTLDQQSSTSLAVLGEGVGSEDCHTIGVDIATAFASSGRTVLLVDADYSMQGGSSEVDVGRPSLEDLLRMPVGSGMGIRDRVSGLIDKVIQVRSGLSVLPSGAPSVSPADAIAGPQFRFFVEQARARFDLVIVIGGAARSPLGQVVAQRTGAALLVVAPGKTSIPSAESAIRDFQMQRVKGLGAVMIAGKGSPRISLVTSIGDGAKKPWSVITDTSERKDSPLARLRFYPSPMEKSPWSAQSTSLRSLVGDLSGGDEAHQGKETALDETPKDSLGSEVLSSLTGTTPSAAYEPVAGYLVSRVEDVLTAVSSQENISEDLLRFVVDAGYLPITPVDGQRTMGEWLVEELQRELGEKSGQRVASEFVRILGVSSRESSDALDQWLAYEFFNRHVERTDGKPEIWHLSSEGGTVQVLAYARRLDRSGLRRLHTDVVRRVIDDLQRQRERSLQEDDFESADELDAKLRDLHLFEVALGILEVGSSDAAKLSYPWRQDDSQPRGWVPIWAEGIKANIAPLQRLGLLAFPVLSEEELADTQTAS